MSAPVLAASGLREICYGPSTVPCGLCCAGCVWFKRDMLRTEYCTLWLVLCWLRLVLERYATDRVLYLVACAVSAPVLAASGLREICYGPSTVPRGLCRVTSCVGCVWFKRDMLQTEYCTSWLVPCQLLCWLRLV